MSRSIQSPTITIIKQKGMVPLPNYIELAQRHFEKEMPKGKESGENRIYTLPVDLLRLMLPPDLVDDVAEIEIIYGK